jgi:hypothetical protein
MKTRFCTGLAAIIAAASLIPAPTRAYTTNVHTTWLWHLHQPIYWPDRRDYGIDHYENAWDTIQQQNAGRPHPTPEVLTSVFDDADRVAAYQGEPSSVVSGLREYPNAGVQLNMSGALMENVQSLASDGQLGYANGWNSGNATARTWTTSSGKPRMDLVNFTYHHAIAPLISDETLAMELQIHQRQMQIFWGTNVPLSRGYWPSETCLSEHMIPILNQYGIAWTPVSNEHLARSCADFPLVIGSGGVNCDIPNPADQINPAQGAGAYQRTSISVGCGPTQVMPFGFQLHYARYVNPSNGAASEIILVPSDQTFSWLDSYSSWDLGLIAPIAALNNPAQPSLVLCAHDGDNAWGGGYSYYNEWVPQMASTAVSDGYEPTTIEQFMSDFPPATNVVHVEDGGWVNPAGDFGSPNFINWNWPPSYSGANGANVVDPSIGVTDKGDNWRVIIATENRVKTAQQISGITPIIDQVRDPGSYSGTPNAVDLGWHYYLASLDSGFVYYGCTGDECLRAIVAQSNACRNVDSILAANPAADTTAPTVFLPQRHPWNPGGTNFGVQYGYKQTVETNTDFWIWTYAYDVSGISNATLFYRVNGTNPPTSDQFKTYAGGPLAGAWQTLNMTRRVAANSSGYAPEYQADYYYTQVTSVSNAFVDYYVSATDTYANTSKSPIQHVWVGAGSGGGGSGNGNGCDGVVCVTPAAPVAGSQVTIQYNPVGGPIASATTVDIHLGWNGWDPVVSPDPAMTFLSASNLWLYTVTIPSTATQLNCCFNNSSGTWANNSGANWNFIVTPNTNPAAPFQPLNLAVTSVLTNQVNLAWSAASGATSYLINRGGSPIAQTSATNYSDTTVTANTAYCYSITASNSVGFSTPSATVCTNTPAFTAPVAPSQPLNLTAIPAATNEINLTWSAASGATGYIVDRGGSQVAQTSGTNYSDMGLTANTAYCYSITASNSVGLSTPSATVCTNTLAENAGGSECEGVVCIMPAAPVSGSQVTIQYNPVGGPIASATSVDIHVGWNGWDPTVSPDPAMILLSASNLWQYTAAIPNTATQLNCCFNNGSGTWANNNGTNWNFVITPYASTVAPSQPLDLTAIPAATNEINLAWLAVTGATGYIVNRGGSPVASTGGTNYSDTGLTASTAYCYSITASNSVGLSAPGVTVCANTLIPAFVLDGAFDYPGYLLASNSAMMLYAALRGTVLYVATESPGDSGPNDIFIFVTDQLSASTTNLPPWAKAGLVAVSTNKPFLAAESQDTYISWYQNGISTNYPCAKSAAANGAMEGTIDLMLAFGYIPTNIYLCAAAYVTTNGGALVAQCPAGSGPNINPGGFLEIPTLALSDSDGSGVFNLLDPMRGFVVLGASLSKGVGFTLNWASMPGHGYQVVYRNTLTNPWTDLPGASNVAGPLQLILSCTDSMPTNVIERFYGVKLAP